jgi:hypothetical protein
MISGWLLLLALWAPLIWALLPGAIKPGPLRVVAGLLLLIAGLLAWVKPGLGKVWAGERPQVRLHVLPALLRWALMPVITRGCISRCPDIILGAPVLWLVGINVAGKLHCLPKAGVVKCVLVHWLLQVWQQAFAEY